MEGAPKVFGVPFSVKDTGSGVFNGRKIAVIYGGVTNKGECVAELMGSEQVIYPIGNL